MGRTPSNSYGVSILPKAVGLAKLLQIADQRHRVADRKSAVAMARAVR